MWPPPRAPSRGALCTLVLAVSTKALLLFLFFFPSVSYLPVPSATAPVCACACVLTVQRCYICSSALFPYRVKLWASAFGGEIKSIAAKYSGSQLLQKVRFLWWQEAMIFFSSTENGGRFSFPNKREPRAASVIRGVSDPPVSWQCTVPVTSPYQPVIFRWHLILNTKKSRILSGTVLAEARKLSAFCMALLSVSVLLFQCESRCSSGQKMLTSCKDARGRISAYVMLVFTLPTLQPGVQCIGERSCTIVCHPCSCTIPLFPNHLDPGPACITSLQIRRMNVVIFPLSCTAG